MDKKWVMIPDVLFFQEGPGVRNTQYTNEGVKLLNVANLVDGRVDLSTSDRYISEDEAYGKYRHFLCDDGDFIVASSGIKVEYIDKKMGFIDKSMLPLCMNTSTIRFKVLNPEKLRIRYFMYYLKSMHFKGQLFKLITGSAQLNYGPSHLKQMKMPLISTDKQDEIINNLDKLQRIIDARSEELLKLDELIKARFVELFEDDIANTNMTIGDIAEEVTVGIANSATHAYAESGVVMLRNQNIRVNYLDDSELIYIKPDFASKYENKKLRENDILVTRTGVNVGMACLVPAKYAGCQTFTTLILRLKKNIGISPTFVCHYINSPLGKGFIDDKKVGGAQPNFGAKQLATMPIAKPSKDKQQQFDDFVKQVDKLKAVIQEALDKTQILIDSLMQQYFG